MSAWVADMAPWIDALGASLAHFLWQGALVAALYRALRPCCASVAARYRLGMAALLLMLACPMATLTALLVTAAHVAPMQTGPSAVSIATDAAHVAALTLPSASRWQQALPWLVGLWLVGVCLIATRSFLHWRRLARIVREAAPLPREWQTRLLRLRERFGILRPVRLLASARIASPTLIGWLAPAILLPASLLSGFTPAQIELIIAHELSHVRRFDYVANLIQIVIETLLFYHPAVHWISREVRQARESCCDDLVLTVGGANALAYARTLADLEARQQADFGAAVPALGAGGGELLARIRRIVDPAQAIEVGPLPRSHGLTLPIVLGVAGLVLVALRLALPGSVATVPTVLTAAPPRTAMLGVETPLAAVRSLAALASSALQPALPIDAVAKPAPAAAPVLPARGEPPASRVALALPKLEVVRAGDFALRLDAPLPREALAIAAPAALETAPLAEARRAPARASGPLADRIVAAAYPPAALQNRITGQVDLDFRIAPDGSVRDIRVVRAQPADTFEQAAIAALKQWHFAPGSADADVRYARSFAFTRAAPAAGPCREVTGSHICRRADENPHN